jgi:creatinine amidohydrolase
LTRWKERVKIGKATIDGVSIADQEKTLQWGRELLEYRARVTAQAIAKTIPGKPNR